MATLQEFRQEHPEYDHIDDQVLADKLHEKYYSHIPKDEYYSKIKFSPAPERSFTSKLLPNILASGAEGWRNLLNLPYHITKGMQNAFPEQESLAKRLNIKPQDIPHLNEEVDYSKKMGLPDTATLSDKLIRGLVKYGLAGFIPGANLGKAGEVIEAIPKIGSFLSKGLSLGAPQAAYGAIQEPEHPLEGAATGLGAGFVAPAIESGINALRPSNLLRGNLTEQELAKNLEATHGTPTGLGRVIESPTLNRLYENILPHVIGSGAESTMQKAANHITQKGEDLLDKIGSQFKNKNLGVELQGALKSAAKKVSEEKTKGFENLNKMAEKENLIVGRENFQKAANDALEDINKSPELKAEFGKDLLKDIKRYAKNPEGNSLKLTNIFRGKIGDKASDAYINGKTYEYQLLQNLKEGLSKDIQTSFENSPNKNLKSLYEQNQRNYAEKYAPFEDPDIVKFTKKGGDPDLILAHFLRGGKNDRATLLSKLSDQLLTNNKSHKMLPAYAHFSKAIQEGEINPIKFASLYKSLGENQRKALIPDTKIQKEIENYTRLVDKNREAFDLMRNPKTGARNTELLSKIAQLGSGALIGGIPGAMSILGAGMAGRLGTKALTSPKLREKLIKAMIENKEKQLPARQGFTTLMNSVLQSDTGNQ